MRHRLMAAAALAFLSAAASADDATCTQLAEGFNALRMDRRVPAYRPGPEFYNAAPYGYGCDTAIRLCPEGGDHNLCVAGVVGAGDVVVRDLPFVNGVEILVSEQAMIEAVSGRPSIFRDPRVIPNPFHDMRLDARPFFMAGPALRELAGQAGVAAPSALPASFSAPVPSAPSLPWGTIEVEAPQAWASPRLPITGAGVTVAVVDTGIDCSHSAFTATEGSVSVFGSRCAYGADFASGGNGFDDNGHGTHVAGTIGAAAVGGLGGVAPGANVVAVKVLDAQGSGTNAHVIEGIAWAAGEAADPRNDDPRGKERTTRRAHIINMSLGGPHNDALCRAVRAARARGVIVAAAAGNSGPRAPIGSPADCDLNRESGQRGEFVYAVSAVEKVGENQLRMANFSNQGDDVDFSAPGVGVLSSMPGNTQGALSGTSMATPHIAGLLALSLQAGRSLENAGVSIGLPARAQGRFGFAKAGGLLR